MPLCVQAKLLRVLEEKEFERVGSTSLIKADFRLLAATNHNLEEMLEEGRFRKDLFYRLNVITLHIPPLRERREDVIPLAEHFLKRIAQEMGVSGIKIDPQAAEALMNHDWPGNARELSNVLERIASYLERDTIFPCDIPPYIQRTRKSSDNSRTSLRFVQDRAEKEAILYTLESTGYNKARAASMLGIHRSLLYKKMKKYRLPLREEQPTR
jgi:transcriptional regulator with PAS, ATPase and Fis domain